MHAPDNHKTAMNQAAVSIKPESYKFAGEHDEGTAQAQIVAK
jgi:hypothetical protein